MLDDFKALVLYCARNQELVAEFNRLFECNLGVDKRSPLEAMIDAATGHEPDEKDMKLFVGFVWECVWCRLPPECFVTEESDMCPENQQQEIIP